MKSKFIIYIPTDTHEATAVSFTKVAGVPLFLRPVLALASVGESVFTIIAPASHRRQLLKSWQRIVKNRPIHLNLIVTKNKLDESNIKDLKEFAGQEVILLNANYIFTLPTKIREKSLKRIGKNDILLYRPISNRMAMIGANLDYLQKILKPGATLESCLIELSNKKPIRYMEEDEGFIIEKFSDISPAEHMLTEHIRTNTQTWVAREINKRISLPISLILSHLRVTPNTITAINMVIGLSSGIGAASKTYLGVLIGAILFQIASIVDGCDGEVAKLTFRTSKFGQYIDSISDNVSLAAFLTGMMIHQRRITHSETAYIWGGFLLVGALLIIAIIADYLKKHTDSASLVTFDKEYLQKLSPENTPKWTILLIKYFKYLFKKDLFSFMFLLFAILGILHWWFYIMVVGVWVAVLVLGYLKRQW